MYALEIVPVISDQLFNRQINFTDQNAIRIRIRYTSHLGNNRVNLGPIGGVERQQPQAGFTESDKPVIPVIAEGPYGFQHVNVAAQKRDPNSRMDWTERMIRMRKEVPEIGWGEFSILGTGKPEVLALRYDWRNNSVLLVHNLSAVPTDIKFGPAAEVNGHLVN